MEIKMKATNIIVSALRAVALSVCINQGDNPFSTIELLKQLFAFIGTSLLFAVFATLFGERYNGETASMRSNNYLLNLRV